MYVYTYVGICCKALLQNFDPRTGSLSVHTRQLRLVLSVIEFCSHVVKVNCPMRGQSERKGPTTRRRDGLRRGGGGGREGGSVRKGYLFQA